jgi:uncharacterized repeat protein (TIGR03803 family)
VIRSQLIRIVGGACLAAALGHSQDASLVFTPLYSFTNQSGDGSYPYSSMLLGKSGVLYGTTNLGGIQACTPDFGGNRGCGTVFALTPPTFPGMPWSETVLYSFFADGLRPRGGLVTDASGALYGTTSSGGRTLQGTVFKLEPPGLPGGVWTSTTIYTFGAGAPGDGAEPYGTLIMDSNGVLYGTTLEGGAACNCGTVFSLTPPSGSGSVWTESILHTFTGLNGDGAFPYAGVVLSAKGEVFGTTFGGGSNRNGTVFRLAPPSPGAGTAWTETILHSFTWSMDSEDGGGPFGGLATDVDRSGALYGTTQYGGTHTTYPFLSGAGVVFRLAPSRPLDVT